MGVGVWLALDVLPAPAQEPPTGLSIPMRDSVVLAADVWRPDGSGPWPVLLIRTPYDRTALRTRPLVRDAVGRGYAVVLQDVRGRYGSGGVFEAYRHEASDGYDTVEWIAAQPWCNGRVGMAGERYAGTVQWLAAAEQPPHLSAIAPGFAALDVPDLLYRGGVVDLSWIPRIWLELAPDVRTRFDLTGPRTRAAAQAVWQAQGPGWLRYLPLNQLEPLQAVAPWYFEWLDHPAADPWWNWGRASLRLDRITAATLAISGWYDAPSGLEGATRGFHALHRGRRTAANLVLGPWSGPDSTTSSYDSLVLAWMDRHLADSAMADSTPAARYYLTGAEQWEAGPGWPPRIHQASYFLAEPDSVSPEGRLRAGRPPGGESFSIISSNPARPLSDPFPGPGPHDYRHLRGRDDLLTFDSAPLASDLDVAGPASADLYVSVDARDTDLWVRILDLAPDGSATSLTHPAQGLLRASARRHRMDPELLRPNRIYRLRVDGLTLGHRFPAGHRIRIQVSTAFFPHFSRNLHTGYSDISGDVMSPARVTVYHDRGHPSRVVLPVRVH